MEVILLRHGKTAGNLEGRYNGSIDYPLCPQGIEGARQAGCCPEVARVYVSPLQRARQTASICFPQAEQVVVEDMREMSFGDFEGRTADEMKDDQAYRAWVDGNCQGVCPHGEGREGFTQRVAPAFDRLVRQAIAQGEPRLIVVAHGGTLMSLMWHYADEQREYYDWLVGNCQGWRAQLDEGSWQREPRLRQCVRFTSLQL